MNTLQSIGDPQVDTWAGLTDSRRPSTRRIRLAEQSAPDLFLTAPRCSAAPEGLHNVPWLADVEEEMQRYLELAPNWDSYGGGPVRTEIVDMAILIVEIMARFGFSRPAVSPESSGGIFLEWEQCDRALSVDLDGTDGFSFAYESPGERELVGDIERFVSLLAGVQPF